MERKSNAAVLSDSTNCELTISFVADVGWADPSLVQARTFDSLGVASIVLRRLNQRIKQGESHLQLFQVLVKQALLGSAERSGERIFTVGCYDVDTMC